MEGKPTNQTKLTAKSSNSGTSQKTAYLEVPAPDLREERFVPTQKGNNNGDLRERTRKRPQGFIGKNKVIKGIS